MPLLFLHTVHQTLSQSKLLICDTWLFQFPRYPYTLHLAHLTHPSNNHPSKNVNYSNKELCHFTFTRFTCQQKQLHPILTGRSAADANKVQQNLHLYQIRIIQHHAGMLVRNQRVIISQMFLSLFHQFFGAAFATDFFSTIFLVVKIFSRQLVSTGWYIC